MHVEAAVHERVQLLRIDPLGDRREADDVGEEHRHVLALALDRGARAQDAVGEVLRRVRGGAAGSPASAAPQRSQ